jgi:hypothetical protein
VATITREASGDIAAIASAIVRRFLSPIPPDIVNTDIVAAAEEGAKDRELGLYWRPGGHSGAGLEQFGRGCRVRRRR